jgi:hypothetical protein
MGKIGRCDNCARHTKLYDGLCDDCDYAAEMARLRDENEALQRKVAELERLIEELDEAR